MLKKINRITKKIEIDQFFGRDFKKQKGISFSSKFFVVKVLEGKKESRLNIILNTKVDKRAVVRNKIKRQIREVFRLLLVEMKKNKDVLIVVLPSSKNLEYKDIEKDLKRLFNKLKII
jgi:ribonuclease P protein component